MASTIDTTSWIAPSNLEVLSYAQYNKFIGQVSDFCLEEVVVASRFLALPDPKLPRNVQQVSRGRMCLAEAGIPSLPTRQSDVVSYHILQRDDMESFDPAAHNPSSDSPQSHRSSHRQPDLGDPTAKDDSHEPSGSGLQNPTQSRKGSKNYRKRITADSSDDESTSNLENVESCSSPLNRYPPKRSSSNRSPLTDLPSSPEQSTKHSSYHLHKRQRTSKNVSEDSRISPLPATRRGPRGPPQLHDPLRRALEQLQRDEGS